MFSYISVRINEYQTLVNKYLISKNTTGDKFIHEFNNIYYH